MTREPTPDAEQEYFADGISEDIIKALSRFHWFFVIARNSSFSYKGTSPDIRDVARDASRVRVTVPRRLPWRGRSPR